jgi:hypothetical protein
MNTRKFWMLSIVAAGLFLAALSFATPTHAQLSGAIFTTLVDGTRVNANIYPSKEDVYLDGGPGPNAPSKAAGLPPGDYYFQVTDPPGKVLLSTDPVKCRRFHVNAVGVIDGVYSCTVTQKVKGTYVPVECRHLTGIDTDHAELGAITVQLMPYDNTPNNGGVYKVWVTPVGQFVGNPELVDNPAWFHGFVPASSKTDNFKVKGRFPLIPITIRKFHDKNVNGVWDPDEDLDEEEIFGWQVTVTDPSGGSNIRYTQAVVMADAGNWTVTEAQPPRTRVTAIYLDGVLKSAYPSTETMVVVPVAGTAGESHEVVFGNVGLGEIDVSESKFYDRNGDGECDPGEPLLPGWEIVLTGTDVRGDPVGPICAYTGDEEGKLHIFANLLPGDYTVTETMPSTGGWESAGPTALDFTIISTLFTDDDGLLLALAGVPDPPDPVLFGNYCVGHADFGTKGYWHNKNGLSELTDGDIAYVNGLDPYDGASSYFDAGDEPFDGEFANGGGLVDAVNGEWGELIAPAGSWQAEVSHFLVDANAGGDPREQLAQQLLAFIFNCRHRLDNPCAAIQVNGCWVPASVLINAAIAVWSGGTDQECHDWQALLDGLNNNDAVPFICYGP